MDANKRKILEDAGVLYPSVVTNADRIRAMTDEELAETITADWCSIVCPGGSFFCDGECVAKITEWLKQEISNDE